MGGIVSFILLFCAIILQRRRKCWFSPDVFFCYMWAVITFFSSLHLYGMYKASDYVYLIILIGSLSFVFGVRTGIRTRVKNMPNASIETQDFISKHLFWVLFLIQFIVQLEPLVKSIALQMAGISLAEIRHEFYDTPATVQDFLLQTFRSVAGPLVEIAGIVYFFRNIKNNWYYFIAVVIIATMQSLINGGRWGPAFLALELLVGFSIFNKRPILTHSNLNKAKMPILILLTLLVVSMLGIGMLRMSADSTDSWFRHYYIYICGNVIFFDLHLPSLSNLGWFPFVNAFWGVWHFFLPIFNAIGIPYPGWFIEAGSKVMSTQDPMQIGEEMTINAFSTPFYYLYADMGMFGVVGGMVLFGLLAGLMFKKMTISTNNKYIIVYLLVCQMIFRTIFNYPFVNDGYVLIFIILLLLRFFRVRI